MRVTTTFPSTDAMEQLVAMGMLEGMTSLSARSRNSLPSEQRMSELIADLFISLDGYAACGAAGPFLTTPDRAGCSEG